jgi:undecaprenyl diphosphate synthase
MTAKIPAHIAIIMDGNGRWAKSRGWVRVRGHDSGVKIVRPIIKECSQLGVKELTLYALSTENYTKRPRHEIRHLMKLLAEYLKNEKKTVMDNNIIFNVIGRILDLPERVRIEIEKLKSASENNTGMTLRFALNYGGRQEILDAVERIISSPSRHEKICEKELRNYMYDPGMSDPDLLIRTGGDMRISNFLIWQLSYSEIYVTDVLWPDFTVKHLHNAIEAFESRQRRFGGL